MTRDTLRSCHVGLLLGANFMQIIRRHDIVGQHADHDLMTVGH